MSNHIFTSPGLFWISETIFLQLDPLSFSRCELVCKDWRWNFVNNELWRKRVMRIISKPNTYRESISKKCQKEFEDIEEAHTYYRTLAWKFSKEAMQMSWMKSEFTVKKIKHSMVRDLMELDGNRIIFAQDNKIVVANRTPMLLCSEANEYDFPMQYELGGHRREVTCLDLDPSSRLAIAGGRDRNLSLWDLNQGILIKLEKGAHQRLITSVKIRKQSAFSSSRDRTVKVWNIPDLHLLQVLQGYHEHSVWAVDVSNPYLITASADKSMNVWEKSSSNLDLWSLKHKLKNHNSPLRNVIILHKDGGKLAVTGDLVGDLRVWNLEKGEMEREIPDPRDPREKTFPGAVVSLSQSKDFFAAAFSTKSVALFDTLNYNSIMAVNIDQYVDKNSFIRNIQIQSDGQIFICNIGTVGILILGLWE